MKMTFNLLIVIFFLINKCEIPTLYLIELFRVTEIKCRLFFGQKAAYWDGESSTALIVLLSANEIADILYVSDNVRYFDIFSSLL